MSEIIGFIVVREMKNPVEVTIISNQYSTLLVSHEENEIDTYGKCLFEAIAFFPNNTKVNVITNNVFVTNTISYWKDEVQQKYNYWKQFFELVKEKNIELFAYTKYDLN